jgi:hypothetical protein
MVGDDKNMTDPHQPLLLEERRQSHYGNNEGDHKSYQHQNQSYSISSHEDPHPKQFS